MAATTVTISLVMLTVAAGNLFGIGGGSLLARLMGLACRFCCRFQRPCCQPFLPKETFRGKRPFDCHWACLS
ncbi:MAG: hypothetical protein IJG80_07330, partial [Selenomonadaceae bacterium]|nr:hypothetical protein [Selenomonadaceae bacterium]